MQPSPDALEALRKRLGREPTDEEMGEFVAGIWREIKAHDRAKVRRAERLKRDTSCWACKHLLSPIHDRPPVYCRAFPKGAGIPFVILAGQIRHDHIIGGEVEAVVFERREEKE